MFCKLIVGLLRSLFPRFQLKGDFLLYYSLDAYKTLVVTIFIIL